MTRQRPSGAPTGSRTGFTLIEVTGALLVFMVGVLSTLGLAQALADRSEYTATRTRVVTEVQERIDSLRAAGYDGVSLTSTEGSVVIGGRSYTTRTTVSQYSPLVRELTVSLTPTSGSGPGHWMTIYLSTPW